MLYFKKEIFAGHNGQAFRIVCIIRKRRKGGAAMPLEELIREALREAAREKCFPQAKEKNGWRSIKRKDDQGNG